MGAASPKLKHPTPPAYPRRFSWKMRLFLSLFIFCLTFRCLSVLLPIQQWCRDYSVQSMPPPLPPISGTMVKQDGGAQRRESVTLNTLAAYLNPWPSQATQQSLLSPRDGLKFSACWIGSRLIFLERILALHEYWELYGPSVHTTIPFSRARLFYADGSDMVIRQRIEPQDYTRYGHWFEERNGNYEYLVQDPSNEPQQWGYCHMLAHRHARNANGAQLLKVVLFLVTVELSPPGADAMRHYAEQNTLTASPPRLPGAFRSDLKQAAEQVWYDFYEYDVLSQSGHALDGQSP